MPRQLGPSSRNEPRRNSAWICLSNSMPSGSAFFEASRNHDGRACSRIHTLADYTGNSWRGCNHNGQVYFLWNSGDIRMTANANDFGAMRIDSVKLAGELSACEIGQNGAPDTSIAISRTDQSYRVGPKEVIERGPGGHFF